MKEFIFNQLREVPIQVENGLHRNHSKFKKRPTFLKLKKAVEDFISGNSEERWIVLTGLRGVGKTTVIYQIYDYLRYEQKIDQNNVLYLSLDMLKIIPKAELHNIIEIYLKEFHGTSAVELSKKIFILIDEAHFDPEWDLKIKSFYDKTKNIFFIITGSSALSLNLSADSSRRIKKCLMPPLNLSEYLLLKYEPFFQPKNTSTIIRNMIFYGLAKVEEAKNIENLLKQKLIKLPLPASKELDLFLKMGGFGFSINSDFNSISQRVLDVLDKVIKNDLPLIKNITPPTQQLAYKILGYLSLKKPGETSHLKLATEFGTSPDVVNKLLDALEKAELIVAVKPFTQSSNQKSNSPWKYYFITPSVHYILYKLAGGQDTSDSMGILWETAVISVLQRMEKTLINPKVNIFYDPGQGGVDFMILDLLQQKSIPIEVGSGDKEFGQLRKSLLRYSSSHGILITDCEQIEVVDNIIKIPLKTFLFV